MRIINHFFCSWEKVTLSSLELVAIDKFAFNLRFRQEFFNNMTISPKLYNWQECPIKILSRLSYDNVTASKKRIILSLNVKIDNGL